MSKLLKFKGTLSPAEAAEMLGGLIDEEVTVGQIEELFNAGWLSAHYLAQVTLMPLERVDGYDFKFSETSSQGSATAVYLWCETLDFPFVAGAFSAVDEEGIWYVMKDQLTHEIHGLNSALVPPFSEMLIEPREILRIAKLSNDRDLEPVDITPSENLYAVLPGNKALYNFSRRDRQEHRPLISLKAQEKPLRASELFAIASLVELAREKSGKARTQESLIDEILKRSDGKRGLSPSSLQKLFADANKAVKDWKE